MVRLISVLLQTTLIFGGLSVLTATAQEPVAGLEEIVVTARKREENLAGCWASGKRTESNRD